MPHYRGLVFGVAASPQQTQCWQSIAATQVDRSSLYQHIRSCRLLPDGTTLQVPLWWQSCSIVPPEPGASADHVMSCRQQALGGISSEAEAAAHAAEDAPPKRKKSSVFPEALQFYFDYLDYGWQRFDSPGLFPTAAARCS